MSNEEKQVEEMAKDLCECYVDYSTDTIDVKATAEKLTAKGYCKVSDVARETIAEAIKVLKEKCLLTVRSDGVYCFEKEDVLFWLRTIPLKIEKQYRRTK